MKTALATTLAIVALAIGSASPAVAGGRHGGHGGHGGHGHHGGHSSAHFGFYFGDPFFWGPRAYYQPYYYPAPYYYEPRTVIIEREPPVYIQRQPAAPAPVQPEVTTMWYYCPDPAGYYPQVPNCPQQWVPVDPRNVPAAPSP